MNSVEKISTRKILFILMNLLFLFIFIGLCFKSLARLNRYDNHLLDSRITSEILKENGSVIRCTPIKNAFINKIEKVRLMPQEYSLRYPLINHEVDFLFADLADNNDTEFYDQLPVLYFY